LSRSFALKIARRYLDYALYYAPLPMDTVFQHAEAMGNLREDLTTAAEFGGRVGDR
jgi:hypothetical protein